MFKVTPKSKMKTSFNLCSDPGIFQCSLYRLMQQVHKCHTGGQPPIALLLPKKKKNEKKKKKCHRNSFSIKKKYRCYVICFVYSFIVLSYSS